MYTTESNKKGQKILWILQSCVILILFCSAAIAKEYYVAQNGDDRNPGSLDKPFATIQKAAKKLKAGDTCYIRGGHYHESIKLDRKHGKNKKAIIFKNFENEQVILDGSVELDVNWTLYKDQIYQARIDQHIWQLFVDGISMCSARWPNGNWIDGSIWDKTTSMTWPEKAGSSFGLHVDDELKGLDFDLSAGGIIIVNSGSFKTYTGFITDHKAGDDRFTYDTSKAKVHFGYKNKPNKFGYFLEGALGLLDTPGEWFYKPESGMLYLWPLTGQSPDEMEIKGKIQSYAFDVQNSDYIHLEGIDFFGTTVKLENSTNCTIENCNFLYPSYSKRMLSNLSPIDVTKVTVKREKDNARNTFRNCRIEYADGPALELNGTGNLIENCYMHHIDYSCTYKGGWTLNMVNAPELVFRRNTVHTTGASELFKAGRRNLIELNDLSRSGYLQNDGSMIQVSVKQQDQSITRYNWVHNSVKQGIRFDNSNKPNSPWGENGTCHHNVAWKTDRIFFKGDKHHIFNNLSFDSHQNDLIISSNTVINGFNYETETKNNISNKFSGHRTKPGKDFPVPGSVDHNWDGTLNGLDIRSQLRDPDNLDFRPLKNSELVDAGVRVKGFDIEYEGKAPDIGPYEYGAENYWIPGFQDVTASMPAPPNNSKTVKQDADLMWLGGYRGNLYEVYFGLDSIKVAGAINVTEEFRGSQENNIYQPGKLEPGQTYYWRIDTVKSAGVETGQVWKFSVR